MVLPSSPFILLLSLLFISSFHGYLVSAQGFTGTITTSSLISTQHASVDASGILTLDATTADAQVFHSQPISLSGSSDVTLSSFTSFFTFASNASSGNGSIVFAFVQDAPMGTLSLADARKTFTLEFNTSCSIGFYGGKGFQGRESGWGGGFQVAEYANSSSISIAALGGYGPNWRSQTVPGPYVCSQEPPLNLTNYPTFQYEVAVEYNASTDTVWVGSPSCGSLFARTIQFTAQDLSTILPKSVYVGFLVSGGGIFNISQWNFTTNINTSSISNLALSSIVSSTPGTTNSNNGGSNGGLKKGYVVAFSVLGAAIGMAAVL